MAIDPDNELTDSRFPRGGTIGHAALLLIDRLVHINSAPTVERSDIQTAEDRDLGQGGRVPVARDVVIEAVAALASEHHRYWSQDAHNPDHFTSDILDLLCDHRLVEVSDEVVWLLPPAWRYSVDVQYQQESML